MSSVKTPHKEVAGSREHEMVSGSHHVGPKVRSYRSFSLVHCCWWKKLQIWCRDTRVSSFISASHKPLLRAVYGFLVCTRMQVDLCQARIMLEEFQGSLLFGRAPIASAPICVAFRTPPPASQSPWTSPLKLTADTQEGQSSTQSRTTIAR